MEIEGNGSDMFRIPCSFADMLYCIFVDLIDRHIKTDVICRSIADIFHDGIIGIPTNEVMPFPVTIQTEQDQICFRQVDREDRTDALSNQLRV